MYATCMSFKRSMKIRGKNYSLSHLKSHINIILVWHLPTEHKTKLIIRIILSPLHVVGIIFYFLVRTLNCAKTRKIIYSGRNTLDKNLTQIFDEISTAINKKQTILLCDINEYT